MWQVLCQWGQTDTQVLFDGVSENGEEGEGSLESRWRAD